MSASGFFNSCVDLFSDTMNAVLGEPVLSFFAAVELFVCAVAVFGWLARGAKKM